MKNLLENSICNVINNYPALFFNKKNVVGIALGYKFIKNMSTKEPSIHVLVKEKLSLNKLYPHEIIPKDFFGLKTDIIETEEISTSNNSIENIPQTNSLFIKSLKSVIRPVQGGLSIAPANSLIAGTLGGIVFDNETNTPCILTNNHVIAQNGKYAVGSNIVQPAYLDSPYLIKKTERRIAKLSKFIYLNKESPILAYNINDIDAAIATLNPNIQYSKEIYGVGPVKGTAEAHLDEEVHKVGVTTGHTYGTITSIHSTITVKDKKNKSYYLYNQIGVSNMADFGDSGSLLLNKNNEVIGLLSTKTFSSPIAKVLDNLDIHF